AALMVSDLLMGPRAAAELADAMVAHRYDVLIGTQIVAKGHHFPMLTLVGVVDADLGLIGGDLRATERNYQLLHQVAGRAGPASRCSARRRRRWRYCAGGTGGGFSSKPSAASICRRRCATGSAACASLARCGCRSISTPTASCDPESRDQSPCFASAATSNSGSGASLVSRPRNIATMLKSAKQVMIAAPCVKPPK